MLFNSHLFIVFLVASVVAFRFLPARYRIVYLCALSIFFYSCWRWDFTFLMIFSTSVDYFTARGISGTSDTRKKKLYLAATLAINFGLLAFFKYSFFAWDNVANLLTLLGVETADSRALGWSLVLPLGISFYTFHTVSYTIDVYRGAFKPVRSFPLFMAYVTFWPQLVAGPILRAGEVVPQLEAPRPVDFADVMYATRRIITGLFKKVVIADNIALNIDKIFDSPMGFFSGAAGNDIMVLAFLFGFQIYCDFAGYSDIALGSARLMGIRFPENFDWPYMARSPREFWLRWHISLSSWIRDYLYMPLLGARGNTLSAGGITAGDTGGNKTAALFLTWLIMGLWHGAAWTFALWGLYHAALVYLFRKAVFLRTFFERVPLFGWFFTLYFSMMGWIFFRAQSLEQAMVMFGKAVNPLAWGAPQLGFPYYFACAGLVAAMAAAYHFRQFARSRAGWDRFFAVSEFAATSVMLFFTLIYLRTVGQFIYFQF